MLSISKQQFDERPQIFIQKSVDEYVYNYDITSRDIMSSEFRMDSENNIPVMKTVYECTPITLAGIPNKAQCTEAVIREFISQNDEFKMINDVRAVDLGIIDGEKATQVMLKYTEYLKLRNVIKSKITEDFSNKE